MALTVNNSWNKSLTLNENRQAALLLLILVNSQIFVTKMILKTFEICTFKLQNLKTIFKLTFYYIFIIFFGIFIHFLIGNLLKLRKKNCQNCQNGKNCQIKNIDNQMVVYKWVRNIPLLFNSNRKKPLFHNVY